MNYSNMTDSEILREADESGSDLSKELANRIDRHETALQNRVLDLEDSLEDAERLAESRRIDAIGLDKELGEKEDEIMALTSRIEELEEAK